MLPQDSINKLALALCEKINRQTGIKIEQQDIALFIKKKEALVKAWDCTLARVRWGTQLPPKLDDFIVEQLTKQPEELRTRIIKCKVYHLNRSLPNWATEIKRSLFQQNVSSTFVNSLNFQIVDHGYRYGTYRADIDGQYDYPFLALKIHNSKDFNFSFPINVYDVIDPVDIEYLKHCLFVAILEQNLHNNKNLTDL